MALTPASAQLLVELPFDAGELAREMRSPQWVGPDLRAGRQEAPSHSPRPRSRPITARPEVGPYYAGESATLGAVSSTLSIPPPPPLSPPPAIIPLSSFDGDPAGGGIRSGTTWAGHVTQGPGFITIGGSARDDNGWGITGLSLDASGMSYLTITAQRNAGHTASALFLQLEDRNSLPHIFSFSAASFAVGTPSTAQIVIGMWPGDFDFTRIASWSIGGGGVGEQDFRMSLHNLEFGTSAIPEPSTYAALVGAAALAIAASRRRRGASVS